MVVTEQAGRRTARVETEAIYAALSAGVVGAVLGWIVTSGAGLGFWGDWPSVGGIAAVAAVAIAIAAAATAYTRSASRPDQAWRKGLSKWRVVVSTISVTIVHAVLAALGTSTVYLVLDRGFIGLTLRPFDGAVLLAASTGLSAYLVYLSSSRTSTKRMSSLLLAFVALGVLTSMATSTEADWWELNFSELGTFDTFSSFAFNGTLVGAGLLVTTFAAYVQTDMGLLVAAGKLESRRAPGAVAIMLVIMGVMLAIVGIVHVNVAPIVHTIAASGMALVFFGLLGSSPWLLRGMPRAYFLSIIAIAAAFILGAVLFAVGFFGLTAFELLVFCLIFGWIVIFIRFLGVADQRD